MVKERAMPHPPRTVLLVDDLALMRSLLKQMFQQLGPYHILEAADGPTALQRLHTQPVDLVTIDWYLGPMSGFALLKAIRADPYLRTIPVLMITVEASKETILLALQAGVSGYIVKPFTLATLAEKLVTLWYTSV
jgi:two-component system chemotaxis response regulator CheY